MTRHLTRIDELVRATHGVVTTPELVAAGYSPAEIRTMVERGHLIRVRRSVFVVGHLALGDDARRMLAVRCAGDGAAVASMSAAISWGMSRRHDRTVDVVVPRARRPVPGARLVIDRRLPREGLTELRKVPMLDPTWTLAMCAARVDAGELVRMMREAAYRRILDTSALVRIAEDHHGGRPGVGVLRRALELRILGSGGYASNLERQVHSALRRLDVPAPLTNVLVPVIDDTLEVDLVWRDLMICVEVDGPIHDEPDVHRDDLERMARLEQVGWTVLRIHWSAWETDRTQALAPLIELLANTDRRNR